MVDAKVIEAVNFFETILESEGIHINDLIFFGSSNSGTLNPGSDIDIAVISDDFSGMDIFTRALSTKDAESSTIRKYRIALDISHSPLPSIMTGTLFFSTISGRASPSVLPKPLSSCCNSCFQLNTSKHKMQLNFCV